MTTSFNYNSIFSATTRIETACKIAYGVGATIYGVYFNEIAPREEFAIRKFKQWWSDNHGWEVLYSLTLVTALFIVGCVSEFLIAANSEDSILYRASDEVTKVVRDPKLAACYSVIALNWVLQKIFQGFAIIVDRILDNVWELTQVRYVQVYANV